VFPYQTATHYASDCSTHPPPWMCRWIPLLTPPAGLNTRYGISRPASRDGIAPLMPSGSTTGFGSGVLPSHLNLRYSAAPTWTCKRACYSHVRQLTSYHRGPSAHILISFSLNSCVCLSASLRSNLDASMVRSDFKDMVEVCVFRGMMYVGFE
jgi:hypothetical protein